MVGSIRDRPGGLAAPQILDSEAELLLYALARDNECECILGMLTEHPENGMRIARAAMECPDPDARWQVAEFWECAASPMRGTAAASGGGRR